MKTAILFSIVVMLSGPVAYGANWIDRLEADVEQEWVEKAEEHIRDKIKERDGYYGKYVETLNYIDNFDILNWISDRKAEYEECPPNSLCVTL